MPIGDDPADVVCIHDGPYGRAQVRSGRLAHELEEGALSRGLIIIKMRGSQHDKRFHEFMITDKGLNIGEPFVHVPTALLGIASAGGGLDRTSQRSDR